MARFRYTAANSSGAIRQGVVEAISKTHAARSLQERGLMLMDLVEDRSAPVMLAPESPPGQPGETGEPAQAAPWWAAKESPPTTDPEPGPGRSPDLASGGLANEPRSTLQGRLNNPQPGALAAGLEPHAGGLGSILTAVTGPACSSTPGPAPGAESAALSPVPVAKARPTPPGPVLSPAAPPRHHQPPPRRTERPGPRPDHPPRQWPPAQRTGPTCDRSPPSPQPLKRSEGWSRFERAVYLRQLALMFNSGVSLFQAAAILSRQAERPGHRLRLERIVTELESGRTLSVVMERSGLFGALHCGTVKVGESTGQLGSLLASLAQLEEQEVDLQRKVGSRLAYPAGVLLAVILGVSVLGNIMGHALTGLLASLPGGGSKTFLFWLSQALASPWFLVLALVVPLSAIAGLVATWRHPKSRPGMENLLLNFRPFGPIWRRLQAARLCRLLAVMVSSGLRADKSLALICTTTDSPAAQKALRSCQDVLMQGEGFSAALAQSGFFPREVAQMAACGEEAGRLPAMLSKVADYCQLEVERFLESACAALEPMLISALGLGVGVVILTTFAPVYQLLDKL